jgi:starch synthase
MFNEVGRAHPGTVAVRLAFDGALARRIYAAADLFLMPSRYEPCGLGQLIALRYGAVPVVHRTGGLADTVRDWVPATGQGTGFVFAPHTPEACREAIGRALAAYRDPGQWRGLVANAMAEDFSWRTSAEAYVSAYRRAIKRARRHG